MWVVHGLRSERVRIRRGDTFRTSGGFQTIICYFKLLSLTSKHLSDEHSAVSHTVILLNVHCTAHGTCDRDRGRSNDCLLMFIRCTSRCVTSSHCIIMFNCVVCLALTVLLPCVIDSRRHRVIQDTVSLTDSQRPWSCVWGCVCVCSMFLVFFIVRTLPS